MQEDYEVNEKDIEGALRWLKVNDPDNANREKAVALLKDMKTGLRGMSHHDPEKLLKLQKEVDAPKLKSNQK